jgi:hypothetical protein
MPLMKLLFAAGVAANGYCVACVYARRAYRAMPVLSTYLIFTAICDSLNLLPYTTAKGSPLDVFVTESIIEFVLEFGMALELLRIILRPSSGLFPRRGTLAGILAGICPVAAASILVAVSAQYRGLENAAALFFKLELSVGIARVLVFSFVLIVVRIACIEMSSRVGRAAISLTGYFAIAALIQAMHELPAMAPNRFYGYWGFECVRMAAWSALMIFLGSDLSRREVRDPRTKAG